MIGLYIFLGWYIVGLISSISMILGEQKQILVKEIPFILLLACLGVIIGFGMLGSWFSERLDKINWEKTGNKVVIKIK